MQCLGMEAMMTWAMWVAPSAQEVLCAMRYVQCRHNAAINKLLSHNKVVHASQIVSKLCTLGETELTLDYLLEDQTLLLFAPTTQDHYLKFVSFLPGLNFVFQRGTIDAKWFPSGMTSTQSSDLEGNKLSSFTFPTT